MKPYISATCVFSVRRILCSFRNTVHRKPYLHPISRFLVIDNNPSFQIFFLYFEKCWGFRFSLLITQLDRNVCRFSSLQNYLKIFIREWVSQSMWEWAQSIYYKIKYILINNSLRYIIKVQYKYHFWNNLPCLRCIYHAVELLIYLSLYNPRPYKSFLLFLKLLKQHQYLINIDI